MSSDIISRTWICLIHSFISSSSVERLCSVMVKVKNLFTVCLSHSPLFFIICILHRRSQTHFSSSHRDKPQRAKARVWLREKQSATLNVPKRWILLLLSTDGFFACAHGDEREREEKIRFFYGTCSCRQRRYSLEIEHTREQNSKKAYPRSLSLFPSSTFFSAWPFVFFSQFENQMCA